MNTIFNRISPVPQWMVLSTLQVRPPYTAFSIIRAGRCVCGARLLCGSRVFMGLTPSYWNSCAQLLVPISEYTVINEACPGAEWNIMCRECCEYDQIECVCPGKKEVVGYTIPCCRNEENECDSCLIHPGECGMGASGCLHVVWGCEWEEAAHFTLGGQISKAKMPWHWKWPNPVCSDFRQRKWKN